jgi:hypothetical protein
MRSFRSKPGGSAAGPDRRVPSANHVVHFYDEQQALLQGAAAFLAGGLLRGAPAMAIVMPQRAEALTSKLAEMGVDVTRALAAKQLLLLDSAATVELLLVEGMPDVARFREVIGAQVAALTEIWRPFQLLAFGDMVDVLYTRGDADAAVELERLWDDLAHRYGFGLYCAYDARQFARDDQRAAFDAICRHHDVIVPMVEPGTPLRPVQPPLEA